MEVEIIQSAVAVPVLIGVLEAVKRVSGMDEKYIPVLSVLLAVVGSLSFQFYGETDIFIAVGRGLIIGLSSVGLYSGAKNTLEAIGVVKEKG